MSAQNNEYGRLHWWVRKLLGSAKYCEACGSVEGRRYEWANISRQYRWELSDWRCLCAPCHADFDKAHKVRSRPTHCKRGHELTEANTKSRNGKRQCRLCVNRWARENRRKLAYD